MNNRRALRGAVVGLIAVGVLHVPDAAALDTESHEAISRIETAACPVLGGQPYTRMISSEDRALRFGALNLRAASSRFDVASALLAQGTHQTAAGRETLYEVYEIMGRGAVALSGATLSLWSGMQMIDVSRASSPSAPHPLQRYKDEFDKLDRIIGSVRQTRESDAILGPLRERAKECLVAIQNAIASANTAAMRASGRSPAALVGYYGLIDPSFRAAGVTVPPDFAAVLGAAVKRKSAPVTSEAWSRAAQRGAIRAALQDRRHDFAPAKAKSAPPPPPPPLVVEVKPPPLLTPPPPPPPDKAQVARTFMAAIERGNAAEARRHVTPNVLLRTSQGSKRGASTVISELISTFRKHRVRVGRHGQGPNGTRSVTFKSPRGSRTGFLEFSGAKISVIRP